MAGAQAEVSAILPESGPMARAAGSVRQAFCSAYKASDYKAPAEFVNAAGKRLGAL